MKIKVKLAIIVSVLFLLIVPTFISEFLMIEESISCDSPVNREDTKYTKPFR